MAIKTYMGIVGMILVSSCAFAQEGQVDSLRQSALKFELLNLRNNWLQSGNAAGMKRSDLSAVGKTSLSYNSLQGKLKLAQQPESQQQLHFDSERYQPLGKALFYGSFSYTEQRDQQLQMSDVLDPYRGTPYLLADSIGGDWKKQLYALKLKAASPKLLNDRLVLGLGVNLNVGTGARQNDPRPLSTSNEISVLPGLTWKLNKHHHIGVNGLYGRYREEVSLEVKNTYVNHYLYKLLGVGQYELPGVFSVGSSRTYNGNKYGAGLQYEFHKDQVSWLNTASYSSYQEEVGDGSTVPRKAGTWKQKAYQFNTSLNLEKEQFFQQLQLTAEQTEDTGIEFHEYFNTDTKTWQTILEAPFYSAETRSAALRYTLMKKSDHIYNWMIELGLHYLSVDKDYTIPASSERNEHAGFSLKGGKLWAIGKNANLQSSIQLVWWKSLSESLSFIPVTGDRTLVAREVLLPDHAYKSADQLSASWELKYNFIIPKAKNTRFYISSKLNFLQTTGTSAIYPGVSGNRTYAGLSLGAYY